MSATQQPHGSIPSAPLDEAHESDEWRAALTRARRDTYEGPDPEAYEGVEVAAGMSPNLSNVVAGHGHAVRAHEQALWAQNAAAFVPSPPAKQSPGAAVVAALVVAAAATVGFLWMHQDHKRLMSAKDQHLERLESQKILAQEARASAESTLANERTQFAKQLEAMRVERNAALNAASDASNKSAAPRLNAPVAKTATAVALPSFPGKKAISNDPLGGLSDLPKQANKKRK